MKRGQFLGYSSAMKSLSDKNKCDWDWAFGETVPEGLQNSNGVVAAIGNFDGVHQGHQHLIAQARSAAIAAGLPLAILTFSPHPRAYFRPDDPPFLLMDRQTKYETLQSEGADMVVHIAFNSDLQSCSAEGFVKDVLVKFGVRHLFAGADFAFGRGRSGDMSMLEQLGATCDIHVTSVPLLHDVHAATLSSSRIRAALQSGQIEHAAEMLGHSPIIAGPVLLGDQRGRLLDFPTANLALNDVLTPAFGVYAVDALISSTGAPRKLQGVANIGVRPTVNDRGILCEVHLFDFDEDIYGERLSVYLKHFIRAEQKFNGLEELKAQITKDAEAARSLLPPSTLTA